jgi:hypothetical protein
MISTLVRATVLAGVLLAIGAPVVFAQTETELEERLSQVVDGVLVGVRDDVDLPAGETADAVVVVQGDGTIEGTARGLVMIDANVTIGSGGSVEDAFAVGGTLTIEAGATVEDLAYFDTTVDAPTGTITSQRDIREDLPGTLGWIAAAVTILLLVIWIGLGVFALVSGLLMVAFGTSQARRAAWLIGNSPLKVLIAGFLAAVLPWILFALLSVTIIGIPLAFGLALVWGLAVFLGYLVACLWVGEHVLRSSRNSARPYGAVFVGVLILLLLSWFPLVTFIAVWFGLGAVTMAGWRVLRGGGRPVVPPPVYGQPYGQQQPYGYAPQYPPPPYVQPPYGQPVEQWPAQDRWPPQQPPASWPG